jgi:hypothetical protein
MVSRTSDDPDCKTTLICAPVALLQQWYDEIRTRTDPPLRVYIHHSSWRGEKAKTVKDILRYDVVLTSYDMIVTGPFLPANPRLANGNPVRRKAFSSTRTDRQLQPSSLKFEKVHSSAEP